jgi:murein DD-endopeptidase MepM/ murein hydrolase activator NlpD
MLFSAQWLTRRKKMLLSVHDASTVVAYNTYGYFFVRSADICHKIRFFTQHGKLPLRERYWKRDNGKLRVRYVLASFTSLSGIMTFTMLSMFPAIGIPVERASLYINDLAQNSAYEHIIPSKTIATATTLPASGVDKILTAYRGPDGQIRRNAETRTVSAIISEAEERAAPRIKRLTIAAGDTLTGLLMDAGLNNEEASSTVTALRGHIQPSDLRPGQTIDLEMIPANGADYQFNRMTLALNPMRSVQVKRGWGGFFSAQLAEKPLRPDVAANVAVIKASLYGSADAAGIPSSVTAEAIRAFSHDIDFQRDIHPGDRMEIMYDRFVTEDGYVARTGGIVFARLIADGRELSIYRYKTRDGNVDYFDRQGRSIRKALLRTPMDGARISSGFGMRRHPVLGYSKMHKGVDFAAPTGTPIYAAGDGIIEKAGRFSSYGNYVRIKHTGTMKTAYAHMANYGPGIRPGVRVRQGQVIGYVGTTGRSTGPHLHYELLVKDQQVNPQSVKMPTMVALDGTDAKKFKDMVRRLDNDFKSKTSGMRFASASSESTSALMVR